MRYLNPKADLTFKKVFGEHPQTRHQFPQCAVAIRDP